MAVLQAAVVAGLLACGTGVDREQLEAASADVSADNPASVLPDWLLPNPDAGTVMISVVAAREPDDRWTVNGFSDGAATIHIPEDTRVTVQYRNADSAYRHSLGVTGADPRDGTVRVLPSATTPYATDRNRATPPGERSTVTFQATRVGWYALACLVPGHAAAGEWLHLVVTPYGPVDVTVDSA